MHDIQTLNNDETEKTFKECLADTDDLSIARDDLKKRIRLLHSHLSQTSSSHSNGHDNDQESSSESSESQASSSGLLTTFADSGRDSLRCAEYEWSRPHAASFNFRRLLFHSGEPNVGQGYIKEQSFSPDGRIIASPFANCVRLLAYDSECHELCDAVPHKPRPLRQVALVAGNKSSVLTSTFSPVQLLYAAGAEDGSISFCSPKL